MQGINENITANNGKINEEIILDNYSLKLKPWAVLQEYMVQAVQENQRC